MSPYFTPASFHCLSHEEVNHVSKTQFSLYISMLTIAYLFICFPVIFPDNYWNNFCVLGCGFFKVTNHTKVACIWEISWPWDTGPTGRNYLGNILMLQRDVIAREWTSDMFTMCYLTYHCLSVCLSYVHKLGLCINLL